MADTDNATAAGTVESAAARSALHIGQGATPETTTATREAQGGAGGLPQFQFQHWAGQIGYLLVLFFILYLLMSRVFAPRIRRVFDERSRTIEEALAAARKVQAEASAQAEEARKALADARARAQRTAAEAKARAEAEAKARNAQLEAELNARLAEAEARIRASRDSAMANVAAIAGDIAEAIVDKLTGLAAPREAVDQAVAKLQG